MRNIKSKLLVIRSVLTSNHFIYLSGKGQMVSIYPENMDNYNFIRKLSELYVEEREGK